MNAIELSNITKVFGKGRKGVLALDHLTLNVPEGGVFGLLGPNGAGKSTLLRMICGLVRPDEGKIRILGRDAGPLSRRKIGALIDAPLFYPFMTGKEVLETLAMVSNVKINTHQILNRVGLKAAADRRVAGYSLGMKQRLGVAAALLNEPEIVILDEPTNGLDPKGIIEMRELVRALSAVEKRTVIICSHLLDELQRVCDRVAILRGGCLIAEGDVVDLLKGEQLWLDVNEVEKALSVIGSLATSEADGILATVAREDAPRLIHSLVQSGVDIYEARWIKRNLEDLFLSETRSVE